MLCRANAGEVLGRTQTGDHRGCVGAQELVSLSPQATLVNVRQLDPVGDLVAAARGDRLAGRRKILEGWPVSRSLHEDGAIRFSNEVKGGRHLATDDRRPTWRERHGVHARCVEPPFPALRAIDDGCDRVGRAVVRRCVCRDASRLWRITPRRGANQSVIFRASELERRRNGHDALAVARDSNVHVACLGHTPYLPTKAWLRIDQTFAALKRNPRGELTRPRVVTTAWRHRTETRPPKVVVRMDASYFAVSVPSSPCVSSSGPEVKYRFVAGAEPTPNCRSHSPGIVSDALFESCRKPRNAPDVAS